MIEANQPIHFLQSYILRAQEVPSLKTLAAARQAFDAYVNDTPQPRHALSEGNLPLSELANWIARRWGRSKRSLYGRWTRYDGSFWRLVSDRFEDNEAAFNALSDLLAEFSKIEIRRLCTAKVKNASVHDPAVMSLEAWMCRPGPGYFLNRLYGDRESRVDGFYSSWEEVVQSAELQFGVSAVDWDDPIDLLQD